MSTFTSFSPLLTRDDIDRRLIVRSGSVGPESGCAEFHPARDSFLGRVLAFLSQVPLLRDMSVVKDYVARIALENAQAMSSFIAALSGRFGEKAAQRSMQINGVRALSPLTARHVRALARHAENVALSHDAKQFARNVNVRIWDQHVSLTMHHGVDRNGRVKDKDVAPRTHVSWWPGTSGAIGSGLVNKTKAEPLANYQADKVHEIAGSTADALAEGRYVPRAGQKQSKDGRWGLAAESLPVALMGVNYRRDAGKRIFTTFGLNEKAFSREWQSATHENQEGRIGYQMLSVEENCAGMAARMLRAAGAEVFVPIPKAYIVQAPGAIRQYGLDLMREMNAWNRKANEVGAFLQRSCDALPGVAGQATPDAESEAAAGAMPRFAVANRAQENAALAVDLQKTIMLLPDAEARRCDGLKAALSRCQPDDTDFIAIVNQTKALVEGIHQIMTGFTPEDASSNGLGLVLRQARAVLDNAKAMGYEVSRLP